MNSKLFEVRDRCTFIPCMGTLISGDDGYLARSAGYHSPLVLFGRLDGATFHYDWNAWHASRTMRVAHQYIQRFWEQLKCGQVIDVEFILNETDVCKRTQEMDAFLGSRVETDDLARDGDGITMDEVTPGYIYLGSYYIRKLGGYCALDLCGGSYAGSLEELEDQLFAWVKVNG